MGDFNVVRRSDERFNSIFCARSARDFNHFIHENGLIDMRMGGHRFTYFRNGDLKMSKLDRFLVCPKFVDLVPSATVTALPREISDHCPILLSSSWCDFGPPPFKMFNSWLSREGFEKVFSKAWNDFVGYGTPDLYLNAKLKHIKEALRAWRRTDYSKEEAKLKRLKDEVHKLDMDAENRVLSAEEIETRRVGYKDIIEMEKMVVMDARQKSKIRWAMDGDENSKLFHGFIVTTRSYPSLEPNSPVRPVFSNSFPIL